MADPAGCLSLAQEALRVMLSKCPHFQGLTDPAMTEEQALAAIYHEGLPKPADGVHHTLAELVGYRPFALVYFDPDRGFAAQEEAVSADGFDFVVVGRMFIELERNATDEANDEPSSEDNLTWRNAVGQIIDDLRALAGQTGYLCVTRIELVEGISWNHPALAKTHGVFQFAKLAMTYEGV